MSTLKNNQKKSRIFLLIIFSVIILPFLSYAGDKNNSTTLVFPTYYHTYGIRKAGAFELFLFLGFKVEFSKPEGLACVRLDSWEDPVNPHDDDEVTVYGVNSGQNNIIYNSSMYGLGVYGIDQESEQLLNNPHGICANHRGDVYIADTGNHRIVRLFNPGDELKYVSDLGTKGLKIGQFISPEQVALDSQGNVYITDTGNDRIQVFNPNDEFKYLFDGNGYLKRPTGIAVTDSLQRFQGRIDNYIIVIDSLDQRISKFTLKGHLVNAISISSFGYPDAMLEYLCSDYYNQVLITDSKNHCIHKFDHNLNYITSFGSKGDEDHQFLVPKGIAIYRRFGQLFIAESTGAQYYWIGTDYDILDIVVEKKFIKFNFHLTEPSLITVDIFDNNDGYVARIANKLLFRNAGAHSIIWNKKAAIKNTKFLKNNDFTYSNLCNPLKKIPSGKYKIVFKAEATYSSRTHFQKIKEKIFTIGLKED